MSPLASAASTDTVVVALRPGADTAKLAKRQKQAARVEPRTRGAATVRVRLKAGESLASAIAALSSDPDVLYAEPLFEYRAMGVTPSDPLYESQWGLPAIGAPEAWATQTGSASVKLAVIDTGVDGAAPDFSGRLVTGWNWVANSSVTTDDNGHGTHVAGIAAATGNDATGVAGVAWGVKVMPLKVLDATGAGYSDNIAAAIRYAADSGCQVVNMSLGATVRSQVVADAVAYAVSRGVCVVAAAGNYGENGNPVCYPAALDGVIAVSSVDRVVREGGDVVYSRSRFSEYGAYVDLAAPGGRILSTMIASRETSGFSELSGTSMAAPYVAGAAALVLSERPDLTGPQVAQVLKDSARDIGAKGGDDLYGAGLLDVASALDSAASPLIVTSSNPVSERGWTNTTTVDAALSWPGATEYRVAEGDLTSAPWRAIEPTTALALSSGDGTKTVSVQFRESNTPITHTYEETDLHVTYSGTWTKATNNPKYSGGQARYLKSVGSRATVAFRGAGIQFVGRPSSGGRYVRVTLDGEPAGTFDVYGDLAYQKVMWEISGLPQAEHTLTLEVLPERKPACNVKSDQMLYVDAFRVIDTTESDVRSQRIVLDTIVPDPPVIESPSEGAVVGSGSVLVKASVGQDCLAVDMNAGAGRASVFRTGSHVAAAVAAPIGVDMLEAMARDAAGNTSVADTRRFTCIDDSGPGWNLVGPYGGARVIAVSSTQPDSWYLKSNGGLFKSDDRGEKWFRIPSTSTIPGMKSMAIRPGHSNQILAVCGDGLYTSSDAGVTWARRWNESVYTMAYGVRFVSQSRAYVDLSGTTVLRWDDGVITKLTIPAGTVGSVRMGTPLDSPEQLAVIDDSGSLWVSSSSGEAWTSLGRGAGLPVYGSGFGVYGFAVGKTMSDMAILVRDASTGTVAMATSNGGASWHSVATTASLGVLQAEQTDCISFVDSAADILLVLGDRVFRCSTPMENPVWAEDGVLDPSPQPLPSDYYLGRLCVANDAAGVALGAAFSRTSLDTEWHRSGSYLTGSASAFKLTDGGPDQAFAIMGKAVLRWTQEGGWAATEGQPGFGYWSRSSLAVSSSGSTLWSACPLSRSDDAGSTWVDTVYDASTGIYGPWVTRVFMNPNEEVSVVALQCRYYDDVPSILVSGDDGVSWTASTAFSTTRTACDSTDTTESIPLFTFGYTAGTVVFDPDDTQLIYVLPGAMPASVPRVAPYLLVSECGGHHWYRRETPIQFNALKVIPDGSGDLYGVGSDAYGNLAAWRGSDQGGAWEQVSLPVSEAKGYAVSFREGSAGRMATYISTNQGLLKTASAADADWVNVPLRPGDPTQSANSVGALQWRDSQLYALGAGGVYEVDDDLFCAAPKAQTLDVGALGFVSDVGTRMSYIAAGGALVSVEDSTTSLPTLPDGTHSLTAYAVDFAGNQSAESTPVIVTIDTTAPETTTTVSAPDGRFGWYRTARPISLVATDNVVGVASTSYSWDSTGTTQPYEGPVTAPEGVHVLWAASVDATCNAEAPMPFEFRVDTTAPAVSVSSPAPGTSLLCPTLLSGSASDANLYAWKVMLGRGSAPSSFVTLASDEGTSLGQPAALLDPVHYASGDYTLRVEGTDEAGNASVADLPVRIDTPTSARWESRAIENDHVRLEFDDSGTVTSWKVDLNASGSPSDDFSLLCGDTASACGIGVTLGPDSDSLQRALAEGGTVSFEPYATSTHAGQRITLELPGQGLTITEDYSLSPHSTWPTVDIEVERTGDASATGLSYGSWMRQAPEAEADDLSLLAKAAGDALEPSALATGTVQAGTSWGALLSDAPAFAAGVVTEGDTPVSISATVSAEPFDRAVGALLVPDLSELASGEPVTSRLALVAGKDTTSFDEAAYVLSSSFAPPSASSLSSSFVSPGMPVTLSGVHFGDAQGLGYVTFAGVEATVTAWSDTAITVLVPEGAAGGYAGVWRAGTCSNGVYFLAGTPPRVDSLSTDVAPPGSEVVLMGADFGTVAGTVTFSGVAAEVVSWSEDSVTAVVPAGAPAGYVGVWRDGICSNGRFFTPGARPSIADIDPMFAPAGSPVTVEGSGFGTAPGQVTLGGVQCEVLSWTETTVEFRVPEGAQSGYVGVWSNGVCSNGVWFGVTE